MKFKLGKADNKPADNVQIPEQSVQTESPNNIAEEIMETAPIVLSEQREPIAERIGEILSKRTKDSQHFKNADGTNSAVFYGEPVFFLNSEGAYEEIDNTLES